MSKKEVDKNSWKQMKDTEKCAIWGCRKLLKKRKQNKKVSNLDGFVKKLEHCFKNVNK